MFAKERQSAIIKLVRTHRRLNFAELQKKINVSPATLRRDLTALEKSGDILRVHGGVLDPSYVRTEVSFDERLLRHSTEKKAIARKAASLIPPGSTVYIDAGSTCLEAGKLLIGRRDVRIITHSIALLSAALHGEAEVLCPGGELRRVSGALVGGRALGALSVIRADFAFVGASALDFSGCYTTEVFEAEMKKTILSRSKRNILLADLSKWEESGSVRFAGWADFHDWVVDSPPPSHQRPAHSGSLRIHS